MIKPISFIYTSFLDLAPGQEVYTSLTYERKVRVSMASNTQGMDEHGNSKLPAKAAAEGTLTAEKVAAVDQMAHHIPTTSSPLHGMNSHGDTVIPEKANEADLDRLQHGLHPQ
jgi:1,6-anhydro-N-acetylmuramate kinase